MIRPLSAYRLRQSASFRRRTGVSAATFDTMVEQRRCAVRRCKAKAGRPREIGGLEDHLPVLLAYYRRYVELAEAATEYNQGLGSLRVRTASATRSTRTPQFSIVAGLVNLEAGFPAC